MFAYRGVGVYENKISSSTSFPIFVFVENTLKDF